MESFTAVGQSGVSYMLFRHGFEKLLSEEAFIAGCGLKMPPLVPKSEQV
jgi:hypothetical protein